MTRARKLQSPTAQSSPLLHSQARRKHLVNVSYDHLRYGRPTTEAEAAGALFPTEAALQHIFQNHSLNPIPCRSAGILARAGGFAGNAHLARPVRGATLPPSNLGIQRV